MIQTEFNHSYDSHSSRLVIDSIQILPFALESSVFIWHIAACTRARKWKVIQILQPTDEQKSPSIYDILALETSYNIWCILPTHVYTLCVCDSVFSIHMGLINFDIMNYLSRFIWLQNRQVIHQVTPEQNYFICATASRALYHLSINYPFVACS